MYVIARHAKIKSTAELRAALRHNCREQDTPNADPKRMHLNGGDNVTVNGVMQKYRELLGDHKARKNAVHAIEYMFSASPGWFKGRDRSEIIKYFSECSNYLRDKFGVKNIVSVKYHFDETTPHAHVMVIPMKDGKLNAFHYIGGKKYVARQFQEDIGKIGKKFGLKRGQEGSKAKHTTIKQFYQVINAEQREIVGWALKGKAAGQAERINFQNLKKLAKVTKEANRKVTAAKASEQKARLVAADWKQKYEQALEDHRQALQELKRSSDDATMSHKKEVQKLEKEISGLRKQVKNVTMSLKSEKQKRAKAEDTAEARWKEKNANYLENLEKDRYANRKNRRENEKRAEYLESVNGTLSRLQDDAREAIRDAQAHKLELERVVKYCIKDAVTLSQDGIKVPESVMDKTLEREIKKVVYLRASEKAQETVKKAAEDAQNSNPMPTVEDAPEVTPKAKKKRSGLQM